MWDVLPIGQFVSDHLPRLARVGRLEKRRPLHRPPVHRVLITDRPGRRWNVPPGHPLVHRSERKARTEPRLELKRGKCDHAASRQETDCGGEVNAVIPRLTWWCWQIASLPAEAAVV